MSVETKITDASFVRAALPKRPKDANKSTFGRVLLVCGSGDMRGAAALSVLGALRCGAGLVTLASTREVIDALSQSIYEAMYFDLDRGDLTAKAADMNAVGYGCGLGKSEIGKARLRALRRKPSAPRTAAFCCSKERGRSFPTASASSSIRPARPPSPKAAAATRSAA